MGVFRKKSKGYTGRYYISYVINGKQHFESTGSDNRKDAEKVYALRKAAIFSQKWDLPVPAASSPRLKAWTDEFLKSVATPSTRKRYRSSVHHICHQWGNDTRLCAISTRSIEEFKAARLEKVGAACTNRDLGTLRRLLNVAVKQRLIGKSPFDGIEMLNERATRRQPVIIDFETERKILANAAPHLRVLIVLLVETGLRVSKEGLQLRWADINIAERSLTVRNSKTISGRRSIPLTSFCFDELVRWRELVGAKLSEFIFPYLPDPTKPIRSIKGSWATAVRKAGLQPFTIYSLRAVFATRLSAAGVPDNFISQLLGHSSGSLLRVYSKATNEYQRDAIRKLEELRFRSQGDA